MPYNVLIVRYNKKMEDNQLSKLRHTCEHVLHLAMTDLFPSLKRAMGPPTTEGFYLDFDYEGKITEHDFPKIEKRMQEIIKADMPLISQEISIEKAREMFKDNPYKLEWVDQIEKKGEKATVYWTGEPEKEGSDVDLCKGPHVESTGKIGAFKLLSVAGAYWHGDEKNKMLTRIYGTAFPSQQELEDHLKILEEAKKRDHRKLGADLDLFTISNEVGPGLILWMPKGTIIRDEIEKLGKATEKKQGYQRVSTPHIAKDSLFILSGHLPYYAEDMYPPMKGEDGTYYLKPMNCPHMHMIYKSRKHSYKELPIRYAEFGTVYRYEDSGTLMGLMRVRGLTQNDAHIYCTEDQVIDELTKVMKLHAYYYDLFGLKDYYVELALPDFKNKKDKYFDNPDAWEKSVGILREAAKKTGIKVVENVGGAAFYGPKFDFNIKSVTGREFGASTNQLDFGSAERFGLTYTDNDGSEKIVPYIIHRAPLGSDERFIGFLIEQYRGAFPLWLAPVQLRVLPISDKQMDFAKKVDQILVDKGLRSEVDEENKTFGYKIRESTLQKVPYMIIIGDKEISSSDLSDDRKLFVSVRTREGEDLGQVNLYEFVDQLKSKIEKYE